MQTICFFFASAILLGNIRSLKVSRFIILFINHKIYQANIRLFEKIQHFLGPWRNLGLQSVKKGFFGDFFLFPCPHITWKDMKLKWDMSLKLFKMTPAIAHSYFTDIFTFRVALFKVNQEINDALIYIFIGSIRNSVRF